MIPINMRVLAVFLVLNIICGLTVDSFPVRARRGIYSLGHGYGGLPLASSLSYSVSPYIHSPSIFHGASYISPSYIHTAPVAKVVAIPKYVGVPIAKYVDPWTLSHGIPYAKYYPSTHGWL